MKVCAYGFTGLPLGKHNVKDPRLDQAHKLVEAKKRTYAQVDVVGDEEALTADVIAVTQNSRLELILKDLEFAETRLERATDPAEQAMLAKIKTGLESEQLINALGLTPEQMQTISVQPFLTAKPVVVATDAEAADFDAFLVRVLAENGFICFLTVGGTENRAWQIKQGQTAQEAAGAIHTDIQKGFIRAEVIGFADFVAAGGETQAKRANKLRLETKQYVVQDYDLLNFRFSKP
jgi:ribosome-binding ATPase YchF (GTP1/OBG family)